ncbi:hypothetical protein GpartN1_g957.t1 [Galdieria partita]|uniref:Uncharacterized protein n=1 Tax=Galdieria partita TaxID=83374 RepID=A0A9C7PSS9_9RHOD|nr:hypothetical protein GpartN1_g957.t1 [Galdieria partita]
MDTPSTASESIVSRTLIQLVGPFKQRATSTSPGDFWLTLPIFATECAERFNFYGFTALLTLYFQQHLKYATQQAAANFNFFQATCYCTPVLGSWLADQFLGKYRTIVYFTLLYLSGQLILPFSSLLQIEMTLTKLLTFLSLFLIALGTGGIKPCVSAFGAEQVEWRHRIRVHCTATSSERNFSSNSLLSEDFDDNLDDVVLEQVSNGYPNDMTNTSVGASLNTTIYFARFYLFINVGAIAGQLICPWTRQVFGWSAAYFVSAIVLFLSLVTFLSGLHFTGYIHIQKKSSTTLLHHIRNTIVRFSNRFFHNNEQNNNHSTTTRATEEWHCIVRISLLLSPIAIFWMCWSQQGATWIQQLSLMEMPRIFNTEMSPAQWTAWNPFIVLLGVPISAEWVYPRIQKYTRWTSTDRIFLGMLLTCFAFVCSTIVQFQIQKVMPSKISAWRTLPQWILLSVGEILVSVSGLELAFASAPIQLKSTIQAIWLLTSALGSLLAALSLEWFEWNYTYLFGYYSLCMFLAALVFHRIVYLQHSGEVSTTEEAS